MITNKNKIDEIRKEDDNKEYKRLGQGNTAEIFQYAENKILKLFREYMPCEAIQKEYQITRIVQNQLSNIPKAFELITYKGRYGIIYEQIIGIDLLQLMLKNLLHIKKYSQMLAQIHAFIHKEKMDVHYSVKEKLCFDIDSSKELTIQEKSLIKQYMNTLPDKDRICHFDLHPGNIMMREETPIIIDWMTACTGDPNADVVRTLLLLQMGEMMHISKIDMIKVHIGMKIIGRAYFKEYKRITGTTAKEIYAWKLPVAAARLSETLTDHERGKLLKLVRKELNQLSIKKG